MSEEGTSDMTQAETRQDLVLSSPEPTFRKEQTLPANIASLLQIATGLGEFGERTPRGDIFVADLADSVEVAGEDGVERQFPGTVVNSHTLKKTGEFDLASEGNKEFSASVIRIPSLTSESIGATKEVLLLALKRANIQIGKKDKEVKVPFANSPPGRKMTHTELVDIPSKPGIVIVVEDESMDANETIRKELLQGIGYKRVNIRPDDKNPNRTIWVGFRQRESQRGPMDATKTAAGPDIDANLKRIQQEGQSQGQTVNQNELLEEVKNSRMIPNTKTRARDGRGTTFQDTSTGDILRRDRHGNEHRSDVSPEDEREIHRIALEEERERVRKETLDERGRTVHPSKLSTKDISELITSKPGFERTDLTCPRPECGNHPVDRFRNRSGNTRFFLDVKTVCEGAHRDGYPVYFEGSTEDRPYRYLGAYGSVKRVENVT